MKNTICIYHSADFDGIFCREIAKRFLGETAEYVGWDYGDPVPAIPAATEQIYMLDISIDQLMGDPRLIWIDHHKSAIERYLPEIYGYRIDGVAACRLTWAWFTSNQFDPQVHPTDWILPCKQDFVDRTLSEPYAVRLAGEYDIWDKRDPNAELFQHGLRSRELSMEDWRMLLSTEVSPSISGTGMDISESELVSVGLLQAGRAIQFAKTNENAEVIKTFGFDVDFEGLRFLACNAARYNSHLFRAGLTEAHDACLGFNWDGSKWRVSLYHAPGKEKHDLSIIASKYGGGGHRGACGFKAETLPFFLS